MRARRQFNVHVDANGDLLIRDVPPGSYSLNGDLHEGSARFFNFPSGKVLGSLERGVEIPEGHGSQSHEPLDLGNLVVQMVPHFKPGDLAPDFSVKTIDDQALRLADFRGRYVLLDFWATWCAPCRGETPNLKAVYDAYGTNPKFAIISLSLDKTPEAPKAYCQTNGMAWSQGFLGDWSKATLPKQYGVQGIPAIFLLNSIRKLLTRRLQ